MFDLSYVSFAHSSILKFSFHFLSSSLPFYIVFGDVLFGDLLLETRGAREIDATVTGREDEITG